MGTVETLTVTFSLTEWQQKAFAGKLEIWP
jgi:hypothetical protein